MSLAADWEAIREAIRGWVTNPEHKVFEGYNDILGLLEFLMSKDVEALHRKTPTKITPEDMKVFYAAIGKLVTMSHKARDAYEALCFKDEESNACPMEET